MSSTTSRSSRSTRPRYAEGTEVSVMKTITELKQMLGKFGAEGFVYGERGQQALVAFEMAGRHYRIGVTYPEREALRYTKGNVRRTDVQLDNAYEAEVRRRWRSLALLVKAKLTAVADEVVSMEEEFLGATVLPNDETFAQWAAPHITQIAEEGKMPPLLPGLREPGSRPRQIAGTFVEGEAREV